MYDWPSLNRRNSRPMRVHRKWFRFFCCLLMSAALSFVSLTPPALSAEQVQIKRLTPPYMPRSEYQENDEGQERRTIRAASEVRHYQLYVPATIAPQDRRPLLILLHGAGRTGVSLVEKWRPVADRRHVILAGLHSGGKGWTLNSDLTGFVEAVIIDIEKEHAVDRNRLYLFGHSAGGVKALYAAVDDPTLYAAVAVHAGMMDPLHFEIIAHAERDIPALLVNGTHDALFPLDAVKRTAHAFADQGHKTKLLILNGHSHWYYDLADFINKQIWGFFEDHVLEAHITP